jgi:hypothetical protein
VTLQSNDDGTVKVGDIIDPKQQSDSRQQ